MLVEEDSKEALNQVCTFIDYCSKSIREEDRMVNEIIAAEKQDLKRHPLLLSLRHYFSDSEYVLYWKCQEPPRNPFNLHKSGRKLLETNNILKGHSFIGMVINKNHSKGEGYKIEA
jgi:hypothetical protein